MKKKMVSILLATSMVASLAGCGSDPNPAAEAPAAEETPAAEEEAPAADAEAETEAPAAETAPASGDLAYSGNISIMHYSTSEESEGNGGSDGFRTCLANWQNAHGNITLDEEVLANDDYKTQIATRAAADDLPDVFLLQGMNQCH